MIDLGLQWPLPVRSGLRALGAHRHEGRWGSHWKHHPVTMALAGRQLRAAERRARPDVVLQIGDLALLNTPFLLYQDSSFDVLLERLDTEKGRALHFPGLTPSALRRLRARQHEIYDRAAGVLAMSQWLADHLVRVSGLPRERVHVVPPAANGLPQHALPVRREAPRRRLLFVGKDFTTKGGDLAVAATALLRRDFDPAVELTVAGPKEWPLPGEVPPGVRFLGRVPVAQMRTLFAEHDLLVMPSRFEGYGIALVEALAHGMPCIARRICAMPEIVEPGVNGDLVTGDDIPALADAIVRVLTDDAVYDATSAAAEGVIQYYRWDRVAEDVLTIAARLP
ncbi:MAG TPA: glycosyltransferase family 4 protein [Amycolatopsis sp.]|nr:glycosyltransferase family 4 protein [Amycolatopsis sp.]